jgi:hypothetical protein
VISVEIALINVDVLLIIILMLVLAVVVVETVVNHVLPLLLCRCPVGTMTSELVCAGTKDMF